MNRTTCRLTVRGETFTYQAAEEVANEIEHAARVVLGETPGGLFDAMRKLILRQIDTIEPEGSPSCPVASRVFADPAVRARIQQAAGITDEATAVFAVDLTYTNIVRVGSASGGTMKYHPHQRDALHRLALWVGEGAKLGRGYQVIESRHPLPAGVGPIWPLGYMPLDGDWPSERRDILATLLRDGTPGHQARAIAQLL